MKPPKNDPAQFEASWLFPHIREVLRPDEVALAVGISTEQVRVLCEDGQFASAPINDRDTTEREGTKRREHHRIMRFSVEAWWLNRLEAQGINLPIRITPQIQMWRDKLRATKTPQESKL